MENSYDPSSSFSKNTISNQTDITTATNIATPNMENIRYDSSSSSSRPDENPTVPCVVHHWKPTPFHQEALLSPHGNSIVKINYYRCEKCSLGTWSNWNDLLHVPEPSTDPKIDRPSVPWQND